MLGAYLNALSRAICDPEVEGFDLALLLLDLAQHVKPCHRTHIEAVKEAYFLSADDGSRDTFVNIVVGEYAVHLHLKNLSIQDVGRNASYMQVKKGDIITGSS